jgi:parallel beta-helix repeat protein
MNERGFSAVIVGIVVVLSVVAVILIAWAVFLPSGGESIEKSSDDIIHVVDCEILDSPGATYQMQNSIIAPGTCMIIAANDIVLDFNGFNISGENFVSVGISSEGYDGATIMNGGLYGLNHGIRLVDSDNNNITEMDIDFNYLGIALNLSSNNVISSSTFFSNSGGFEGGGVALHSSDNNKFSGLTMERCDSGFFIENSTNNIIIDSRICDSIDEDFYCGAFSHNIATYSNVFDDKSSCGAWLVAASGCE